MHRLMTSRKLWGALLGSLAIIGVLFIGSPIAGQAVTTLGVLWGAAITGQAAKDFIAQQKKNKDGNS